MIGNNPFTQEHLDMIEPKIRELLSADYSHFYYQCFLCNGIVCFCEFNVPQIDDDSFANAYPSTADSNPRTSVTLAIAPTILAAASMLIFKKRR
jgi:hypothetical protein